MHFRKTFQAGLSAFALALAACQSDTPLPQDVSTGESYRSPADVRFLYDEEGNVARQLPVEILKGVQADLMAQGHTALSKDLEAIYDFRTGEVKDPLAAERAERFLKSHLPESRPMLASPGPQSTPLRPEDLPAGIAIPQELIEGLRKAAVEGAAK